MTNFAWTVGCPTSYDKALALPGRTLKTIGGWVWPSLEKTTASLDAWGWKMPFEENPCDLHPYKIELPGPWEECVQQAGDEKTGVSILLVKAVMLEKSFVANRGF